MGISWHEAKALIGVYKTNGPFDRTATIGRQFLYFNQRRLKKVFKDAAATPSGSLDEYLSHPSFVADDFFRLLGATEVTSFDYSDFEGATITHDMNFPLPEAYHNAFDVVYDGGTLEHIFNFPQAIRNCMMMPRVSGLLIVAIPANNWMGHGFYQFSPELFFRIFCEENGFTLQRMIACEYWEGGTWFEVQDPMRLGRRIELWGADQRISLLVVTQKVRTVGNAWTSVPLQSDYSRIWTTPRTPEHASSQLGADAHSMKSLMAAFLDEAAPSLMESIRRFRGRRRARRELLARKLSSNKQAFKKVSS